MKLRGNLKLNISSRKKPLEPLAGFTHSGHGSINRQTPVSTQVPRAGPRALSTLSSEQRVTFSIQKGRAQNLSALNAYEPVPTTQPGHAAHHRRSSVEAGPQRTLN